MTPWTNSLALSEMEGWCIKIREPDDCEIQRKIFIGLNLISINTKIAIITEKQLLNSIKLYLTKQKIRNL